MVQGQALSVKAIDPADAAGVLAMLAGRDPLGIMEPHDIAALAASGKCFKVSAGEASAVYVIKVAHGRASVEAAAGEGRGLDMVEVLDGVITAQADGLDAIHCQTARRGLVKKLKARGWRVAGFIMEKRLK